MPAQCMMVTVEEVVTERDEGLGFRSLPHNDEAEQALLGALLVNNEKAHIVSGFLLAEHFYQPDVHIEEDQETAEEGEAGESEAEEKPEE